MKFQTLCAAFVLALLTGGAWAEQAQSFPSGDLNAGGGRPEEKGQPLSEGDAPQVSLSDSSNSTDYAKSGWERYDSNHYQEALGDFQKAISLNPTNAEACFGLGNCHYQLGEYEQAADSYRQYVILKPNPKGYYWFGTSLLNLLRFTDAEEEFSEAINLDSTKPAYYDGLGYCLLKLKRYAEAIPVYKQAVSLGGENVHRCASLGFCYLRTKDYTHAQYWYRKCISLDPHNSGAYLSLGESFYALKSYQQAESEYRHAVELAPTNYYAHLYLGDSLYMLKSYQQAEGEYRQAIEIAPDKFGAHLYMGDTLFYLRRFTQAADAYHEAIRIDPEHFGARFGRGYSLMASFRFAEAIPDLEKAHQLKKEDKWARYVLFGAYLATSQFGKASGLYPIGYNFGVGALLISFGFGAALLLKKSFEVSSGETPGLGFSVCWVLIYFEGQIACIFVAGLFGLTFASGSVVVGMLAAPIPLLVAAIAAFPNQTWGAPFTRPRSFPWKWVGSACLALILIYLGDAGYVKLITEITHTPLHGPRNLQFIEEMIKGRPALAVFAGVILWPMAEEVLFRGLLFGALQKRLNTGWTILITAIVFAVIHADPVYFLPLIAVGVLLGWVRNKTGSVWISALIHILNNALAFAALALGQGT